MQIASEKKVFIFDLIKLHSEVPAILDDCLTRILMSPRILKLGKKMFKFISLVNILATNIFGEPDRSLTFYAMIVLTFYAIDGI